MDKQILSDAKQEDIWLQQLESQWQAEYDFYHDDGSEIQAECFKLREVAQNLLDKENIDILEAYSEMYRVACYMLDTLTADIENGSVIVFQKGCNSKIISSEKASELFTVINRIDLSQDEIIDLTESKHYVNINNIRGIFAEIFDEQLILSSHILFNDFTLEAAYIDLQKIIIKMNIYIMQQILNFNIRWERDSYKKGQRLLSRKTAKKISRSCKLLLKTNLKAPITHKDHTTNIDFFGSIQKKINTAPVDCGFYHVKNTKREQDLQRFMP